VDQNGVFACGEFVLPYDSGILMLKLTQILTPPEMIFLEEAIHNQLDAILIHIEEIVARNQQKIRITDLEAWMDHSFKTAVDNFQFMRRLAVPVHTLHISKKAVFEFEAVTNRQIAKYVIFHWFFALSYVLLPHAHKGAISEF
jgi:hypothetical protein